MNEQPLDYVVVTPQVGPPHVPGFVHVGKASFDAFDALAQQLLSTLSSDPPTVLVKRRLLFFLAKPVAAPAIRF